MNISGRCKIFKHENDNGIFFSTAILRKLKEPRKVKVNGKTIETEYESMFLPVQLPLNIDPDIQDEIDGNDRFNANVAGFISFFTTKDGEQVTKLVVTDLEVITDEELKNGFEGNKSKASKTANKPVKKPANKRK